MAINIQTVDEAIQDNGLKILVHGQAGTGKTVLTTTANKPTILISAESGLLSIKNAPKRIKDLMRIAQVTKIDDVEEAYWQIHDGAWECEWLMLDSITEIAEKVLSSEREESKDPRAAYGQLIEKMTKLIKMFRDLEDINILMTCKQTRFTDEVSGVTSYIPMMPGAKLAPAIPYLFDEVFAMRVIADDDGEDQYLLQTQKDIQYEAKDRSGMLSKLEPANLQHIADKIHGKLDLDEEEYEKEKEKEEESEKEEEDGEGEEEEQSQEETKKKSFK